MGLIPKRPGSQAKSGLSSRHLSVSARLPGLSGGRSED